jgi:predicted signal transduction protein with EAL and GGDEF domain
MELPQGLEPGISLSSISNLNHFAKSTYVCTHEKSFYIYHLNGYVEKHKVLYMSIELLCCNFKLQHALLTHIVITL